MERKQCKECGVFTSNECHVCVDYDPAFPCETCGAPTVFVMVAAPGVGQGRSCTNNHYHGTCRELTLREVM